MGCRLHAIKKYEVEYCDGMFNWQQDNFTKTLDTYEVCFNENFDENGCGNIEIEGDEWDKFLTDFEESKGENSRMEEYSYEEQLEYFKSVPKCSDGFVRFAWF